MNSHKELERWLGISWDTLVLNLCARDLRKTTYTYGHGVFSKIVYEFTYLEDKRIIIGRVNWQYYVVTYCDEGVLYEMSCNTTHALRRSFNTAVGCNLNLFGT